jgi:CPA1 family monovalent cation:H+ antiporter
MLDLVSVLLALTAVLAFLNARFLKLPQAVGLLLTALLSASALKLAGIAGLLDLGPVVALVGAIDFRETLLDGMLGLLLFAGALHVDAATLREQARPVAMLATVGTVVCALAIAGGIWWIAPLLGLAVPFVWALAFGILLAPTDPIAVGALLKKAGVPGALQKTISGESLFNDGIGVVLFLAALAAITSGAAPATGEIARLLAIEVGGGLLFGFGLGLVAVRLLRQIDDYQVEILLTLAFAFAGFTLARHLHVSGVLGMVVLGLMLGRQEGGGAVVSTRTKQRLDEFWELVDEILNATLFVLIGVEVLILDLQRPALLLGLAAIPLVLAARWLSVVVAVGPLRHRLRGWPTGSITLLTWAGVRGGISIALALALPAGDTRTAVLTASYVVVCFSILVQGLTVGQVARRVLGAAPSA